MRTTIEISDEVRAGLLALAARRHEKGFSQIVEAALRAYLRTSASEAAVRRKALRALGSLSRQDARDLATRTRRLREHWR